MPVGTTAAILIGSAIASGTGIATAKMASNASKNAANTQVDAAKAAQDVNLQIYQQQRADTLPMLNRANAAGDTLSALMGLPGGGQQQAPQTLGGIGQPAPNLARSIGDRPSLGKAMPRIPAVGGMPASGMPVGWTGPIPGLPNPLTQNASSYVTMLAPTGETQQVPEDQVPYYISKGATPLGGG